VHRVDRVGQLHGVDRVRQPHPVHRRHHRVDKVMPAQPVVRAVRARQIEQAVLGLRDDKSPRTDPDLMPGSSFRP